MRLHVNRATVYRYSKKPTPRDLQHYATEIKRMYLVKESMLLAQCFNKLKTAISVENDTKSLLMAVKILSDNINSIDISSLTTNEENEPEQKLSPEEFYERISRIHESVMSKKAH